jgi:sulfate adenylyltransferase subunit 2
MNKKLLEGIRPLLWRLGIDHGFSASSAKASGFKTKHKKMYQITISGAKSSRFFLEKIQDIAGKFKRGKINKAKSIYKVTAKKVKKIKKLPPKKRVVYDIEVEDTHNFICNGIVCHNSTTLLHLVRKSFFGEVPMPVIHIDTSFKFPEIYEFRDKYAKEWNLKLIIAKNERALSEGVSPERGKFECCTKLKTEALKQAIVKYGMKALLLGIRRDEHGIRAKERYFSPRDSSFRWNYQNQPPELWEQYNKIKESDEMHFRIHPLLHWKEIDIWRYIKRENLPIVGLYFSKNGFRYRSIGCKPCCNPIPSNASNVDEIIAELETTKTAERAGRAQDKEQAYIMQKLRTLGYM